MARTTTAGSTSSPTTANRILDVAERLAQRRGFNGFSYADIAAEVGVTTASLHYHFPTKADLGKALVTRYTGAFRDALVKIADSSDAARAKLEQYADIYGQVLGAGRMCLCGMFAAEYATLPMPVQQEVRRFFEENERWLTAILDEGKRAGTLGFEGDARDVANSLTGALEGAMLLARSYEDDARFSASARLMLATLTRPVQPPG